MFSHKTEVYFQTLQVATYVMLISKVCAELQQTLRKKIIAKKTTTTKNSNNKEHQRQYEFQVFCN
jgi:hypothetical protein